MNENNELILHLYKSAEMGVYSTTCLVNALKNKENKIKHVLESELKEYESFLKLSEKILKRNKISIEGSSLMSKISSNLGVRFETLKDNSDSAIAEMLIEGFTMGVLEMNTKIDKYKHIAKKKYLSICKDFMKFQENEAVKLKAFI